MPASRDDFVIAIRSAFLKKGTQQRFSLISLIIISIILLSLEKTNFKIVNQLRIGINEIVYRSSYIVSMPENYLKATFTKIKSHFTFYNAYENMKIELKELQSKNLKNETLVLENEKLKKLFDDYLVIDEEKYAKVLIDKNSPFLRSVVLNKGSKDNIRLGMAIMDNTYLVGKIVEVNYLSSRALLLADLNSKIPVSIEPQGIQAIMSGSGEDYGIIQYSKKVIIDNSVEELTVLTSGAGGIFKSGIPIGKLKKSVDSANKKQVEFYSDFSQLKYVKIKSFKKIEN
jgi:rod shape-determining protein MreC